jgi:hypothetical protein
MAVHLYYYSTGTLSLVLSINTKGPQLKFGTADRIPRETLEARMEKTPSNAPCFAHQGSSLMFFPILESLMGTAY